MSYNSLLTYGDFIPLQVTCNVNKLFEEIKDFSFQRYNPRKPHINRNGLSITSLDGELGGIDLDSFKEYNKENGTNYDEHSFRTPTQVYYKSEQIRKLVEPFKDHLLRSHIIHLPEGGYFPPHRDRPAYGDEQFSFRVLIPLKNCNVPKMYFMYEDKPLFFEHGRSYFLNTNKYHSLFSFKDSYMIVLNVDSNEETYKIIGDYMLT